ncbi:glycosyl transferase family protein [Hahella sp. SMD15-11]|uniref:Glycosyl transferase family protein n=1 Tax=Thermohahella caldifontis TaxID=3142973 RepID=A0AB39UXL4_9GAMM
MKNAPRHAEEHPFAQFIRILGKGKKGSRSLTRDEACTAFGMILDEACTPEQLGAFLMLLRVKEESPDELAGFVEAARERIRPPHPINVDLDWSSYAGKRRQLPWFVLSTLLLAENGYRVFMHGAKGHTLGRLYTEDVFRNLGLPVVSDWEAAHHELEAHKLVYMPLADLCPRLEHLIQLRPLLGLRSPVHSLARLLNPLDAPSVVQGIFHPPYGPRHAHAAQALGYAHVSVIKGEGGEAERNPDTATTTWHVDEGSVTERQWPSLFERRHVKPEDLDVAHLKAVWQGGIADEYGEAAVVSTCALALVTLDPETSEADAVARARTMWQQRNRARLG